MTVDYGTLIADKTNEGSIKNWVNNTLVPSGIVLSMAEEFIYRRLRVRQMLVVATGNMVADQDYVVTPDRYVGPRSFWISGVNRAKLAHKLLEDVEEARNYDTAGDPVSQKPKMFWCSDTRVNFECPALEVYPYRFTHYAQLAALGGDNETNFLTDRHPLLLTSACLWAANLWLRKGEDALYYQKLATDEIDTLNGEFGAEQGADLDLPVVVM
jgi:hypothetical protein